jgi:DNA recombination protein RmuC
MTRSIEDRLTASQRSIGEGLAGTTELFGSLQSRLGRLTEMTGRVERLARGVERLDSILRVPKLRGIVGERSLETMLGEVLPERFWSLQHRFSDGRVVDAVIRLGELLVPVDAKFPLEAFRRMTEAEDESAARVSRKELDRAVKARVDEIAGRYLRPDEGTTDFALMFIPAEGVWGEVIASGELLDHALAQRVLPVSPASLYAYLSTVAFGLRGLDVEATAREIVRGLGAVEQELGRLAQDVEVLGRHLHHAGQRHLEVERRLGVVSAAVERLGEVE